MQPHSGMWGSQTGRHPWATTPSPVRLRCPAPALRGDHTALRLPQTALAALELAGECEHTDLADPVAAVTAVAAVAAGASIAAETSADTTGAGAGAAAAVVSDAAGGSAALPAAAADCQAAAGMPEGSGDPAAVGAGGKG